MHLLRVKENVSDQWILSKIVSENQPSQKNSSSVVKHKDTELAKQDEVEQKTDAELKKKDPLLNSGPLRRQHLEPELLCLIPSFSVEKKKRKRPPEKSERTKLACALNITSELRFKEGSEDDVYVSRRATLQRQRKG